MVQQARRAEAEIVVGREDDMIIERHASKREVSLQPVRQKDILPAGAGIAGGMSVKQQHQGRPRLRGPPNDLAHWKGHTVPFAVQGYCPYGLCQPIDEKRGQHFLPVRAWLQRIDKSGKPVGRMHRGKLSGTGSAYQI
ncbi:hypothetical protein OOT33_13450 [Sphingobium sp. DEHP117]|nr:hypothetical protein [Sphingobium sp. DEHP117]MDQ4421428.1 hypothetical protein [Sphingobium sp. DEHP117]